MDMTIVLVYKIDTLIAAQVIVCMLQRESESPSELIGKDESPFQLVFDIVFHRGLFPFCSDLQIYDKYLDWQNNLPRGRFLPSGATCAPRLSLRRVPCRRSFGRL